MKIKNILNISSILILLFNISCKKRNKQLSNNSIMIIAPYRHSGTWVFDDPATGLVREPFVAGIPEIIDYLVKDIPEAENGFRMLFSGKPFPGYMMKVTWRRAEMGGNWYYSEELDMEGWLCPALSKYFKKAPKEIYVKVEKNTK